MYVCLCACMYVHACMFTYVRMFACIHVYYMHVFMYVCRDAQQYRDACLHACIMYGCMDGINRPYSKETLGPKYFVIVQDVDLYRQVLKLVLGKSLVITESVTHRPALSRDC